ncbi:MAG: carbohydrate binding domain-containing protein [Sedimentisphaerales bacterium]|nr:carbohydrate binding domain-containing protein [Sedimentisphaerales bacterium]
MPSNGFCKSLFLLLFLSLASAYGNTNILVNPGFESGTDGWSGRSCQIEAVTSVAHSGSGSAKATGRTANWQGVKQSVFDKMVNGNTYRISGWVRLENAASAPVALSVEQQDGRGTHYHNVASATATDSNWVLLSGNLTLDVNGTLSFLDVYFEGPAADVNFYVDDANVFGLEFAPAKAIPIEPEATGEIDAGKRCQKIEGFGASGAFYVKEFVNHRKKAELYNLLFKELGLDILRIRNCYDINRPDFDYSVEIAKSGEAALGGNLKILITSWSPPARLKSNGKTTDGTLVKINGKYAYAEFAQWWADSLVAYEKAGVKADYITLQNELNYKINYDSCNFAPAEDSNGASHPQADLPGYDAALEAVWQKLNTEMGSTSSPQVGPYMPKILAPETYSLDSAKEYIDNIDNLSHVYGYAHHLYDCSGCGATPDRYISKMENFKSNYGNKPLFQTEFAHDPNTWTGAMNTAILVHNCLTAEEAAAYLYWELFWGPGEDGLVSLYDPCSYTIRPAYYAFKQYSAFIDSGWQRVEAGTDNPGLRVSAYISPDNKRLTAVVINTTARTDITIAFSFKGFSVSKGEVYRSSESEKCVLVSSYNESESLKAPAKSITTLLLSTSDTELVKK